MRPDPAMTGSGEERIANDAYFTRDPQCVNRLADFFNFKGMCVLEPCAGVGHMVKDLRRWGAKVRAWDKVDHPGRLKNIEIRDFLLQRDIPAGIECIVTNPPFDQPAPFIRKALALLPNGHVAMLLRHEWMCGKGTRDGRQALLCSPRFKAYLPILGRPTWHEEVKNGPRHNYGWYVWGSVYHSGGASLWL